MAGGTDKFYAALESAMIRPGSAEGGQKGMMDVDDSLRVSPHELWRQNLHVARQHHEADAVLTQQGHLLSFHVLLADRACRDVMKRDAVELCQPLRVRAIADDERDFAV